MSGSTVRRLTPTGEACEDKSRSSCMGRMATLEKAVARLEQSNSELSDDVRAAMAESKRRSAALDNLARLLLASDAGVMLLKKSSKAT